MDKKKTLFFVRRFGCLEDEMKLVMISAHPPPKISQILPNMGIEITQVFLYKVFFRVEGS